MVSWTDIDTDQVKSYLQTYPEVIRKHYAGRIKDDKKRAEAISRDDWRYELSSSLEDGQGMSLQQLEKLVQWKM
jgi:hypothetical protein